MQSSIKNNLFIGIFLCLIACSGSKVSTFSASSSLTDNQNVQKTADLMGYSVESIVAGDEVLASNVKSFSLFPNHDGELQTKHILSQNFSGWNHTTNNSVTEWKNLKLEGTEYNLKNNSKKNCSDANFPTLDIVLLKKILDWNHQHANGFECNILAQGYKFGDIENLVFELKINSAKTNIPSVESLKKTYAGSVNESIVDVMEGGKVNIGITLSDSTNQNGTIIFQLDQMILSDKWVRVTIPMNKLSFYQEINYTHSAKTLEDLNNVVINRMLVVGETKNGAVLRRNISSWSTNLPETFKEMDISFKKIEFQLK